MDGGSSVYDINVIYNHARSRFSSTDDTNLSTNFAKLIIEKAESWGYRKTFYHERDALPGRNMFTELFKIIHGSKFTIVILTPGFLKNCWAKYCQLAAFKTLLDKENSDKLIPVVLGVKDDQIPENLKLAFVISFDPGSYMKNSDDNEREWQRLKRQLAGEKQECKSKALPDPRDVHIPIQNSEPPGPPIQHPEDDLQSLLREEGLGRHATNNLLSAGSGIPNSSLHMDGPASDIVHEDTFVKQSSVSTRSGYIASGGASGSNVVTLTQLNARDKIQRGGIDDTDNGKQRTDENKTRIKEQTTVANTSRIPNNANIQGEVSERRLNDNANLNDRIMKTVGNRDLETETSEAGSSSDTNREPMISRNLDHMSLDSRDLSYDDGSYRSRNVNDQENNQTARTQTPETGKEKQTHHDEAKRFRNYKMFGCQSHANEKNNEQATKKLESNQNKVINTTVTVVSSLNPEQECKTSNHKPNTAQNPVETPSDKHMSFENVSVREKTTLQQSSNQDVYQLPSSDISRQVVSKQSLNQDMYTKQQTTLQQSSNQDVYQLPSSDISRQAVPKQSLNQDMYTKQQSTLQQSSNQKVYGDQTLSSKNVVSDMIKGNSLQQSSNQNTVPPENACGHRDQDSDLSNDSGIHELLTCEKLDLLSILSDDNSSSEITKNISGKISKSPIQSAAKDNRCEQDVHDNVKDNVSPAEDGCGKYLTDTTRGGEQSLESKEDREAALELSERPDVPSQRSTLQTIGNFISGTFIRMVTNPDQPFLG